MKESVFHNKKKEIEAIQKKFRKKKKTQTEDT